MPQLVPFYFLNQIVSLFISLFLLVYILSFTKKNNKNKE